MSSEPIADSDVDELYTLAPGEFIAARDKLAQRLKQEGHKARAAELKRLAKPSISAWVVNRLARTAKREVLALLEAGEALREAQADAVAGRGSAGMKAGMQARRDAVSTLLTAARGILAEAGLGATPSTLERVAEMLNAIAAMPDPPALGRLSHDVVQEDTDLASLLGGGAPPPIATAQPKPRVIEEAPPPPPKTTATKQTDAEEKARAARVAKASEDRDRAAALLREHRETAKSANEALVHANLVCDRMKRATADATARARDAREVMERAKREAEAKQREADAKQGEAEAKQAEADRAAEEQARAEKAIEVTRRALSEIEADLARAEADLEAKETAVSAARKA